MHYQSLVDQIRAQIARTQEETPGLGQFDVEVASIARPSVIDPDHPLVHYMRRAVSEVEGRPVEARGMLATSDSRWILLDAGIPDEQEREVTRLYAETSTPTAEIARQFDIAESSVYRMAQRHRVPPRGQLPTKAQPEQEASAAPAAPELRQAHPRPLALRTSAHAARNAAAARRASASPGRLKVGGGGTRPFRVRYEVEAVLLAVDVRDALRRAEARGITQITAVTREDCGTL